MTWGLASKFIEGTTESGNTTEATFCCYILKSIFRMFLHQGNTHLLYAQLVYEVIKWLFTYSIQVFTHICTICFQRICQVTQRKILVEVQLL